MTITKSLYTTPLYSQLRNLLADQIASGKWKPGESLPNETLLAQQFGTSVGTVRKALDIMEAESLLVRKQGRGTFVNDFSETPLEFTKFFDNQGKKSN